MRYTTLFFDLDDTLYASDNGLWEAIRVRMGDFMAERLGLPPGEIPALRRKYYETYGTTLRGLQRHHQVDAEEYLAYVHDLPLETFLKPAPELRALLLSLPQRKWIFTNADADHAHRVLAVMGLQDCFDGIIDVRAVRFCCKPEAEAFRQALNLAGESDPRRCVLIDDSPRNLAGAQELGFTTVLVGPNGMPGPAASLTLPDLLALPQVMPELWDKGSGTR